MQALVIGNGESRGILDLQHLSQHAITVGCNALHRDFIPDHLVCCDNRMVKEALTNPLIPRIYTREKYYQEHRKIAKQKNVWRLPGLPYQGWQRQDTAIHWGSGPYSVLLAAALDVHRVDLIGFDLYGIGHRVNNMYKNTQNYAKAQDQSTDPSYWIYQIKMVFKSFPDQTFVIYNNCDWILPREWQSHNVSVEDISTLIPLTLNTHAV